MNKNAIKKYAVWARLELIERVSQRALIYGVSAEDTGDPNAESVNGHLLTQTEKRQRQALICNIKGKGYEQVVEEVAYTWFNRFAALRFMEVNGYLPSHIRVFTNDDGEFKPQILSEAIHLDLDGLDREKVYELEQANKNEELFKYLMITQCNALSSILPGMFQKIEDYTELLLPDYLLREGSVIEQMVAMIPESDWKDQVQIIGWLYQYYNSELKDKVSADLKKNIKITKERIPAATQLFTPDWIVRYMVENSLGRLWVEGHPDTKELFLPSKEERDAYAAGGRENPEGKWHYYLEEAPQEPEVQKQLDEIWKEYAALTPEEILCIDPCAGSGHILCYQFDVLFQIYQSYGYTAREAVAGIIEKNLWGLDIDDRAAQLAYFAVMMKARKYDSRFLSRKDENGKPKIPQPHVYPIVESNGIGKDTLDYFCAGRPELTMAMETIIKELYDAKEYGSILTVTPQDWGMLYARLEEVERDISVYKSAVLEQIKPLVQVAKMLAQKYHAVVTNPPYAGANGLNAGLSEFLKANYPDAKYDLFAAFIEKCLSITRKDGTTAMITQQAWMFLSSFEKLREEIRQTDTIVNMAHLGNGAFGAPDFGLTAFVLGKYDISDFCGTYVRLESDNNPEWKERVFLSGANRYTAKQSNFSKIPRSPVAYWVSEKIIKCYSNKKIYDYGRPCKGIDTGDNDVFLRIWYEVEQDKRYVPQGSRVSEKEKNGYKWFPYNKGGEYRKWYGNNEYVINWSGNGLMLKNYKGSNLRNKDTYFEKGITWSTVTSGLSSFRYFDYGFLFDNGGSCLFAQDKLYYIQGLLNSVVTKELLKAQRTINNQPGTIGSLPMIVDKNEKIEINVKNDISLSRADWDSFETSWDFQCHPLVRGLPAVKESFEAWKAECETRFLTLKANEEELNRIFIGIYGLQDELMPEEKDKDVTVHRVFDTKDEIPEDMHGSGYALTKRDVIVSIISYAVGCMFGRYSLDVDGLAYAGGEWDASKYKTFIPDKDCILPISDDEYFSDDIVNRFVEFVRTAYGEDTLEENLKFIADALGGSGTPREVIRKYFLNDFYADHCRTYQKRPIYWLFDSGRKSGFKCLIYMHRYQPDTLARIRTDYLHEQQARYRTAISDLENRISGASTSERVKLNKRLQKIQAQAEEVHAYEEKVHHLADQMIKIDLDDGVKHNYEIFKDVLAKIK